MRVRPRVRVRVRVRGCRLHRGCRLEACGCSPLSLRLRGRRRVVARSTSS